MPTGIITAVPYLPTYRPHLKLLTQVWKKRFPVKAILQEEIEIL